MRSRTVLFQTFSLPADRQKCPLLARCAEMLMLLSPLGSRLTPRLGAVSAAAAPGVAPSHVRKYVVLLDTTLTGHFPYSELPLAAKRFEEPLGAQYVLCTVGTFACKEWPHSWRSPAWRQG
jgi:hypothetical protein